MKSAQLLKLAALLLLALAGGCATTGSNDAVGDWNDLEGRAVARWEAIIAGDYASAYGYLSPGYRSGVSRDAYIAKFARAPVERNGVEYRETICSSEARCEVRLMVSYVIRNMLPGMDKVESTALVREDWIQLDNGWFHAPEFN